MSCRSSVAAAVSPIVVGVSVVVAVVVDGEQVLAVSAYAIDACRYSRTVSLW